MSFIALYYVREQIFLPFFRERVEENKKKEERGWDYMMVGDVT